MRRMKPVIVHIIWAVAGSAVGATAALLWVNKFKVEWVEAMGTWFGAIATVLALLWAVQTFRSDQAHREHERVMREAERAEEADAALRAEEEAQRHAENAIVRVANGVSVKVFPYGGAERRPDGGLDLAMLRLRVTNESSERVLVKKHELAPPLREMYPFGEPFAVRGRSAEEFTISIEPAEISDEEFNGARHIARFVVSIIYTVADRTWTRDSTGAAARMVETGSHD